MTKWVKSVDRVYIISVYDIFYELYLDMKASILSIKKLGAKAWK